MTAVKEDFVVVGSVALYVMGLQNEIPKDIDIVVNNLTGVYGDLKTYVTDSNFSKSGQRAYIHDEVNPKIDIFIEKCLPEYEIIKDIRVQTTDSMLNYYTELLPVVAEVWKDHVLNKIKILTSWQEKI